MTSFMHDSPFSLILCWSLSFLLLLADPPSPFTFDHFLASPLPPPKSDSIYGQPPMPRADKLKYGSQSWVECMGVLRLRHSVQLSSAELNIPSLFNSAELNLCCNMHSVQLSRGDEVYSGPTQQFKFPAS